MRHTMVLAILLCCSCEHALFAQNTYNLSQFGGETGRFFTQPIRWDGRDWLTLGLIGAGTFAAMQADEPMRTIALRDRSYEHAFLVQSGRIWGESYTTPILAIGVSAGGWITGDTTARKIGFEIGQAVIYSAVITQVLSKTVGRARPNQNLGRSSYQPFTVLGEDYHSLPGGHTTAAFLLSTVLSRNISSGFLKVLVYAPALLTFGSRVYTDHHWTSDNVLGAAIGYFVATWVVDQHDEKEHRVDVSSVYPLTLRLHLN